MARGRTPNRLRGELRACRVIVDLCEDLEAAEAQVAALTASLEKVVTIVEGAPKK